MHATLWGNDHEVLDEIASADAGPHVGLALTRGRYPKTYRYEDPNEDAVAAVSGTRATLLVCADGHNGLTASHVALQAVLDAVGDEPPSDMGDDAWLDLFTAANDAVLASKGLTSPHPASGTVLLVALVTSDRISYGSVGDAALIVCRPGAERGRQLNKEVTRFLGQPMNRRALKGTLQRGSAALSGREWVALVTDGLSEFVNPLKPADVVPRVLAAAGDGARGAAVAIVEAACSAGAGDNVGAVVLAPDGA